MPRPSSGSSALHWPKEWPTRSPKPCRSIWRGRWLDLAAASGFVALSEEVPMGEFVRLEVEDGVATIRLDRPPMNAINQELTRELHEAATEAASRDGLGALVNWG